MKKRHQYIGLLFIVITLLFLSCNTKSKEEITEFVEDFSNPWEKCVEHQEIPDGLMSLSAKDCGTCHQNHYEEWKSSTHANAWTDQQFQAELKKESSPYMCINCHIPIQNQQEYIVDGLINGDIYKPSRRKNPHWNQELQKEGITCAACHVRNNSVVGPTGTKLAPHKTVKDTEFLSESLCIGCHNAVAVVTPQLACSFETGDEWKSGPYHGKKNCIDCHMEEVKRSVVNGYEERISHFHSFPGSGIPKIDTLTTGILNALEIKEVKLKSIYQVSDKIRYTIELVNEHAGHNFPTGDPERFILIDYKLLDGSKSVVWKSQDRIGEKWQWHPIAKKLYDNNMKPKEQRVFTANIGNLSKGKYEFMVTISKHRMDQKTADYNKLDDSYPLSIIIYENNQFFQVR